MAGMVSGLSSGIDTASLVSQLIAVERNQQTLIRTRLTTEQSNVKTLQDLNTKLASLAKLGEKLAKPDAWNPVSVTSSSDKVVATGTPQATSGATSFTVKQLAVAHAVSFGRTATMKEAVVAGDPTAVKLTIGGVERTINAGDGTLAGLVNGINAPGSGLRAGLVRVSPEGAAEPVYRLNVTAANTGEASQFTLTASDGTDLLGPSSELARGTDAKIQVGPDTVSSSSNTFAGAVNGLDITLKPGLAPETRVDLTVTQDADAVTKSVKELVDAVNGLLGDMDKATAYAAAGASRKTGTLAGDAQVRSVRNALLDAVYPGGGNTLADVGIQTDRTGKLVLDEATLKTALAADPAKVAAAFTAGPPAGYAERLRTVAKGASDFVDGTLTGAIKGRTSTIDRLEDSIAAWDQRLELRQKTLTRQFTAMETALSTLNSQSSWLGSQLASLNNDRT